MSDPLITRREAVLRLGRAAVGAVLPAAVGCGRPPADDEIVTDADPGRELPALESEDEARLRTWVAVLRDEGFTRGDRPFGEAVVRVGELALGTPYEAFTLEQYIHAGDSPMRTEPLTLSLTEFDCVSLVESCLAIARIAIRGGPATWEAFGAEMERMRYRNGQRGGYVTRLHYFSEWLDDNERRGLIRNIGRELGAFADERPLRFMSSNPDSYPAMSYPEIREEIASIERTLDDAPRWVVPTNRIDAVVDRIRTGDILAFATSIPGLDVTHAAFAYTDAGGVLRVLHAPLSGGVVEITRTTVAEYVNAIRQATGILVARPLLGPPE